VAVGIVIGALLGYGVGQQLGALARSAPTVSLSDGPPTGSVARAAADPLAPRAGVSTEAVAAVGAVPELGAAPAVTDAAPSAGLPLPGVLPAVAPARASEASVSRRAAARDNGSTLAQELSLLQRARRALNHSDGRLALGIVQSLDERFPNGVLMEERAATRILSLCQLERSEEAREQGHRFLAAHPRSVYAERVRDSCAGGQ
jgi:hypothetical protein